MGRPDRFDIEYGGSYGDLIPLIVIALFLFGWIVLSVATMRVVPWIAVRDRSTTELRGFALGGGIHVGLLSLGYALSQHVRAVLTWCFWVVAAWALEWLFSIVLIALLAVAFGTIGLVVRLIRLLGAALVRIMRE